MKVLLTILMICVCAIANAQTKTSLNYYSIETLEEIGTSEQQQLKIREIKNDTDTKVRAIKNDDSLSEEQKKAEYKKIYAAGGALYNSILNQEQISSLKILQQKIAKQNLANGFQPKIDSNFRNPHYEQRMDLFRNLPLTQKSSVFLGNSITERGMWHELFPRKVIVNRGIGGDNTFGILFRLNGIIESKPEKVFLLIGINDIGRGFPVDLIISNYKKIVLRILNGTPTTKIYVQSVLPMNDDLLKIERLKGKAEIITQFNKELYKLSNELNITYIDLYDLFSDGNSKLRSDFTQDGIHITPKAYAQWANLLKEHKYL